MACPSIVFIVPYRNRAEQLEKFSKHMQTVMEDYRADEWAIYYMHQCDDRPFNRGAMKNIGLLFLKNQYPENYRNITIVLNDVDCMPARKGVVDYLTRPGVIKHFYGFEFTLGGIVSINAGDFERINGFPNLWAWGYEDNMIQHRATAARLKIDRSVFYKPFNNNNSIIHLQDGPLREVNRAEFDRYVEGTAEGIRSITGLVYSFDESIGFVNITQFSTGREPDLSKYHMHDLKNGTVPYDTKFGLMYNNRRYRKGTQMLLFRK